jgi:hypothetical protein
MPSRVDRQVVPYPSEQRPRRRWLQGFSSKCRNRGAARGERACPQTGPSAKPVGSTEATWIAACITCQHAGAQRRPRRAAYTGAHHPRARDRSLLRARRCPTAGARLGKAGRRPGRRGVWMAGCRAVHTQRRTAASRPDRGECDARKRKACGRSSRSHGGRRSPCDEHLLECRRGTTAATVSQIAVWGNCASTVDRCHAVRVCAYAIATSGPMRIPTSISARAPSSCRLQRPRTCNRCGTHLGRIRRLEARGGNN